MRIRKLTLRSFRNIAQAEIAPHPRFTVLHGDNGQGKTNLLESMFLLGTLKSFRSSRNRDLPTWGAQFSFLKAEVEREGTRREIALVVDAEGKKARVDGKGVARASDFFGCLNVVLFSPDELLLAKGEPEGRRRYLDRAVFGGEGDYLSLFHEYTLILRNRNALLKSGRCDGLDIWTEKLAEAAARVVAKRVAFLEGLARLLPVFHAGIADGEEAQLRYRCRLEGGAGSSYRDRLQETLAARREEEIRRGTTLAGPHRDDIEFLLGGKLLREHASQGQQRTFILALKMAEIELLSSIHGHPPVLLLDDMTSELDSRRTDNLFRFLRERQMQVFITTTSPETIRLGDDFLALRVERGAVMETR